MACLSQKCDSLSQQLLKRSLSINLIQQLQFSKTLSAFCSSLATFALKMLITMKKTPMRSDALDKIDRADGQDVRAVGTELLDRITTMRKTHIRSSAYTVCMRTSLMTVRCDNERDRV